MTDPTDPNYFAFSKPMYTPHDAEKPLDRPAPSRLELSDSYVAPGAPAQYETGILYRADHETLDDGICRVARLHARALHDAGLPVRLQSIANMVRYDNEWFVSGEDMLLEQVLAQVKPLRKTTIARAGIIILHTVIWEVQGLLRIALPVYAQRAPGAVESILSRTIVNIPWERSVVSSDLIAALNRVGQVWLACEANARAFESSGLNPAKVRILPNAYDPAGPACQVPASRPVPPPGRRYYTIGKWEPRKAHHNLIGAFLLGNHPADDASLLVKTHAFGTWDDYPQDGEESLRTWLADARVSDNGWRGDNVGKHVRIEERVFTDAQIGKLHELNNIYVSASHGEMWDYPAFDALCAGNALVHVGYGGTEDYARAGPSTARVGWKLGPVHTGYHWEKEAEWAHYPVEALVLALLRVRVPERRVTPAHLASASKAQVGARMRDLVLELCAETGVKLSAVKEA